MDKTEKERLLELIKAKKQGNQSTFAGKQDIYDAKGRKRKGIKQQKQGGLFDK